MNARFINRLLLCFCSAFIAFPAVAAEPPTPRGNVSTTVNPTTGYRVINSSTIATPPNATISSVRDITPVVSKYSGGLQQSMPAGINIDGVKQSTSISTKVRATTNTLKGGAKTLLKGGVGGLVLTAGLQALLDGIDAVIEDGSVVQRKPIILTEPPEGAISRAHVGLIKAGPGPGSQYLQVDSDRLYNYYCQLFDHQSFLGYRSPTCYYVLGTAPDSGFYTAPMPDSAIDDAVDNSYEPEPEDWKLLSPIIEPDDIEISELPASILGEPTITTSYDAQGNPTTTTETTTSYEPLARDNPSSQPKIDLREQTETKTYEDGQLTGTTTTTSTTPAPAGSAGGGSQSSIDFELPPFCSWASVVCDFINWFKAEPDLSEKAPDLPVNEITLETAEYVIDGGAASCPAPYPLELASFGSYEVSYESFCELAETAKPLYLTLMSVFAALLIYRSVT